jgi:hypothetical protein
MDRSKLLECAEAKLYFEESLRMTFRLELSSRLGQDDPRQTQ